MPQQAAKLLEDQHIAAMVAGNIGRELSMAKKDTMIAEEEQQKLLQPLLLSPHCLPCVASTLVLHACSFDRVDNLQAASDTQQPEESSGSSSSSPLDSGTAGSSSSSSPATDGGSSTRQPGQRQQSAGVAASPADAGSSRGTAVGSDTLSAC
jgi:hypothetical protein